MSKLSDWLGGAGKVAVKAGGAIGRKIADGYGAIDPDVMRHLLQVPLLSYSLFVSRSEDIEAGEPDGYSPLIFVHGLGSHGGEFLLLSRYLRMMGRKRSYAIRFDDDQSVVEKAAALARFIRDVKKATGEAQVEVVAHSLGGVVARLAIANHRLGTSVQTLITLGSPHNGTYPARFGATSDLLDLRPDSELMEKLNSRPWPKNVRGVTFWSRNDLLILPAESAAMEGAEQVDTTPFTHYSYLLDPRSWVAVARALDGPAQSSSSP